MQPGIIRWVLEQQWRRNLDIIYLHKAEKYEIVSRFFSKTEVNRDEKYMKLTTRLENSQKLLQWSSLIWSKI